MLYATDEDIAVRASADYPLLCPRDQKLSWGIDGHFSPGDPWTLGSASVDFTSAGVALGHTVLLTQPAALFRPPGELFAVEGVGPAGLRLRRKGHAAGVGFPPGPAAGVSQVEFAVNTLGPQIALACDELNRRYGIDDLISGRRSGDLFDPGEVREAVILTVLCRQYQDMSRPSTTGEDLFAVKARVYRQELDALLARTVVHWSPAAGGPGSGSTSNRFGTRVSR